MLVRARTELRVFAVTTAERWTQPPIGRDIERRRRD
jgi:hypothetical protein